MTSQASFLQILIEKLNQAGIEYMLSGSYSSSLYGLPRATNDTDIIIEASKEQLTAFIKSLGDDYYVNPSTALEALSNRAMFNVIDIHNSFKADFIIRKDRPFSREEFQRRQKSTIMALDIWVVSPEDVILSKLEWAKESKSSQQFQDALGVVVVQYGKLDKDYLYKWAKELQIETSLEQLLKSAEEQLKSG
ncbi:MAG: hypothetical protein JW837_10415 [Sedimentisphaerales bacterium]|nr:hypothetical protein [Sedimentisphaerales bacterium]